MKEKIVFYISSKFEDPKDWKRFETDSIENVKFANSNLTGPYGHKLYIEYKNKGLITFEDYGKEIIEESLKGQDVFWDFVEKVREKVASTGDKNTIKEVFEGYPEDMKVMMKNTYNTVDTKLWNTLWAAADDYEENHPSFYLSEDGMMDLIPYLISLGKREVESFYESPETAFAISETEWEYPFNLLGTFLHYEPEEA